MNKRFRKPALFIYTPLLVPDAFDGGTWNAQYPFGRGLFEHSIVRPFKELRTVGIACGHFIPEEKPEALDPILLEFFA